MKQVIPVPEMRITESVQFAPGEYDFFEREGLVVEGDGIVIDGCGATLIGGHRKLSTRAEKGNSQEFGYESKSNPDNAKELGFFGIGIKLENRKNIIVKNLKLKGFDMGAYIAHCDNIVFENCDFSDCFTDPDWGWDDHGFHGGILMLYTNNSTIKNCRANNVWDALNMRYSHNNVIVHNNFSHTSNTGLKMWNACRNIIEDNDFSYGIRKEPGEVHARDSACVLIESGSNDNIFRRNNMTHGGDGLFIRVLNGWMSTGNLFEENDCSYANNNAIEAWADNNIYIRNKANYSSYGFWLGNSDNSILIGNEVAYNGVVNNNAPEAFGNAGIAVVNGSGSHYLIEDNYIHDNLGPGIAIRYTKDYPSYHWIIQNNRIVNNKTCKGYKGHGIYVKNAKFLTFGKNHFEGNEGEDIYFDDNVSDVSYLEGGADKPAAIKIKCSSKPIVAGKPVSFSVEGDYRIRWDLGDGTVATGNSVTHIYEKSGFYPLAVTADNNQQAVMDFLNVYVCEDADYIAMSPNNVKYIGEACSCESTIDKDWTVTGLGSLKLTLQGGIKHTLEFNITEQPFDQQMTLSGYIRYLTDTEPDWNRQLAGPEISLIQDEENYIVYRCKSPFMQLFSRNEYRNNWLKLRLDEGFCADERGKLERVNKIRIAFNSTSESYTHVFFDGFCFVPKYEQEPGYISISKPSSVSDFPRVIYGGNVIKGQNEESIVADHVLYGDNTVRIIFKENGYYGVEFGTKRFLDRVDVWFYQNPTDTTNSHNESIPKTAQIECLIDGKWEVVCSKHSLRQQRNIFQFSPVLAEAVRVAINGDIMAIYGFEAYHTRALTGIECRASELNSLTLDYFEVKLRKERNGNYNPLGDLVARVYTLDKDGRLDKCLIEKIIPEEQVISGGITKIPIKLDGLVSRQKYALALGQTEKAKSRTEGDYYRWIAGHAGYDETFAIFTGDQTKASDYNWGTAWLKVFCNGICADYSHDSEHVGVRFGLEGMEYRYMTFTMPDSLSTLCDGVAAEGSSYVLSDGELIIDLKGRSANVLNIWVDKAATLMVDGVAHTVQSGLNQIKQNFLDKICLRLDGTEELNIYELELMSQDV